MKRLLLPVLVIVILVAGLLLWAPWADAPAASELSASGRDWREYQGGPGRNQYSTLNQITPANVQQLEMAWQYHTGDTGQIQCNPIIVNGVLFGMTATTQPFAVEAATGREIWRKRAEGANDLSTSRGLVYWEKGEDKRILYTSGEWLYAVEAATGKPVAAFGENGRTSLKAGLGETAAKKMVISNTPGTVYEDLIIMPLRVSEGSDASLGHVQAFNIRTGELAWAFHTIPQPGEYGYDTWPKDAYKNTEVGAGNNWAGMAVDRERGIVYVPTGSAAFDFYGGNRKGSNLFANTLLALNAKTGERIWHYQLVHHDILDRDPPAPPNLVTITRNGKKVDAVAQVTKQGYVFVFDRETGEPLFPIEERPVPASDIPGEEAWPTQPFPTKPAPYARQKFTEADISPYAENREELVKQLRNSRSEGPFTPLSANGTVIYPGLDGGAEWGGAAADPEGILYLNSSEMAWHIALGSSVSEEELASLSLGKRMYTLNCTPCHGAEREGNPSSGFPSLVDISSRREREHVANVITKGKGMMPAFSKLSEEEKKALVGFLYGEEEAQPVITKEPGLEKEANKKLPYQISGYTKFLDSKGYPAVRPPWGTLNAIDLNTGEYVWKVPYGEYPELMAKGIPQTGAESYGGPVVTASGLLFIAGTKDGKFRAYDKKTGKLLWETQLPAAAFATPSTYEVNGKQYVVIACGGTKLGAAGGDSYVAFALPEVD
ncbi:outer membrane protein assembly factor BamB family protein [Pontibacter russatus]|uniref:outer membrane protein assembly factor BamB family protein n=1 Tax=Pontibacter russatus TaxID=2694929 RepID=UPI001379B6C9|nr:PQQ-binding-like beta-propeller repeat protein [Pontibacter russatus]